MAHTTKLAAVTLAVIWGMLAGAVMGWAEERVRIGVPLPLSGDGANEGVDLKNLLNFANEKLAGGRYELLFEDDRCSDKDAVAIAQKFVSVLHVKYVIGFSCSGAVLASAPVYEKGRVLAMALATGAPGISRSGDYIFRTMPNLATAAEQIYGHAVARHKRIGLLAEETGYAQEMAQAILSRNSPARAEFVVETYLPGTTDFRNVYAKFQAKKVTALILLPQAEPGLITLYKQVLELKWKLPIYTAFYAGYPLFLKTFGTQADGILFADLPFVAAALDPAAAALFAEYTQRFGVLESSEFYFITALAGFKALDESIRSGEEAKDYLYRRTFSGLFGQFGFDRNGDVRGPHFTFVLKTLRAGRPVMLSSGAGRLSGEQPEEKPR